MLHQIITGKQITFTDSRYYATDSGKWLPSVTTLLDAYPKSYAFMQWLKDAGDKADEIRNAAGDRGSTVHKMTEDYDAGLELSLLNADGFPAYSLEEWRMFSRYVEFTEDVKPKHILSEQNIVSETFGCAGTIDRVAVINGKRYVLDIKTSNAVYNSYWLQIAAYQKILHVEADMPTDGVAILWLNAKTRTKKPLQGEGWQLIIKEDTDKDWQLFQAVQQLWLVEHEDEKPKQLTYQLSFKKGEPSAIIAEYKPEVSATLISKIELKKIV